METSAEGATAPETLRQKDREGDELLESGIAKAFSTEGVIRNRKVRGNLSGPMTEGREFRGFAVRATATLVWTADG